MTREERKEYNYWLTRRKINGKIEKQCSRCKVWKIETENYYFKNKSKPEIGYAAECKICAGNRTIENLLSKPNIKEIWHEKYVIFKKENEQVYEDYREIHREERNEYTKEWQQKEENKGKMKQYSKNHRHHDITETEWRNCLNVFGNQCAYCGLPIEKHIVKRNGKYIIMNLHKDHVDDKGANDLRNAVPACRRCNSRKHERDMEWWYKRQKFFSQDRFNKIIWWVTNGYKDYIEEKPPYKILREKNEKDNKYHFNLWSVDKMRNTVEIIATKDKQKDLDEDIKEYLDL